MNVPHINFKWSVWFFHPDQVGKRILIISLAELGDSVEVQDYSKSGYSKK